MLYHHHSFRIRRQQRRTNHTPSHTHRLTPLSCQQREKSPPPLPTKVPDHTQISSGRFSSLSNSLRRGVWCVDTCLLYIRLRGSRRSKTAVSPARGVIDSASALHCGRCTALYRVQHPTCAVGAWLCECLAACSLTTCACVCGPIDTNKRTQASTLCSPEGLRPATADAAGGYMP